MNNIVLSAKDIKKSFLKKKETKTEVLKGISLEIYRQDFTAIMGPSGAGKSTLLHILAALDTPDEGSIFYFIEGNEYPISTFSEDKLNKIRNHHIGFVFQFHHLLPEFTALENVMMPALIRGDSYAKAAEIALSLMVEMGVDHRKKHKPMELSGGEQQRTAIARALINNPRIIFADEPTGNLDAVNTEAVLSLLEKIRNELKLTIIVATHSNEIAERASRIVRLKDGLLKGE